MRHTEIHVAGGQLVQPIPSRANFQVKIGCLGHCVVEC